MGGGALKAAGAVGAAKGIGGGAGCPSAEGGLGARFPRTRVLAGAAGTTGAGELVGVVEVSGAGELAGVADVAGAAALVGDVEVVADGVVEETSVGMLTDVVEGGLIAELGTVTGVVAADDEESVDEALADVEELLVLMPVATDAEL